MIRAKETVTGTAGARHELALRTSSRIGQTLQRMYWPGSRMITPKEVIRLLNRAGVHFVLMGNYGITGWRKQKRATDDVDVLVQASHHRKAVKAIRQAYPNLRVEDLPVVTRVVDRSTETVVIGVMKPVDDVYQAVFQHTVKVGRSHSIPDLEMALLCKFAAMVSPNRLQAKKYTDAGDFMEIVQHNYEALNFDKLWSLGEIVYSGGGDEIRKLVEDSKAGRRLEF